MAAESTQADEPAGSCRGGRLNAGSPAERRIPAGFRTSGYGYRPEPEDILTTGQPTLPGKKLTLCSTHPPRLNLVGKEVGGDL